MVVVEPPGKAFDAAFGLRPIGHFRGDVGQLRAFAAHDAADERRQGVEVAGEVACGRSRIGLREGVADGMPGLSAASKTATASGRLRCLTARSAKTIIRFHCRVPMSLANASNRSKRCCSATIWPSSVNASSY